MSHPLRRIIGAALLLALLGSLGCKTSEPIAVRFGRQLDPVRYLELLAAFVEEDDATVLGMLLERLLGLQSLFKAAPELSA